MRDNIRVPPPPLGAGSGLKLFAKVISSRQKWAKSQIQKKIVDTTFWLNLG